MAIGFVCGNWRSILIDHSDANCPHWIHAGATFTMLIKPSRVEGPQWWTENIPTFQDFIISRVKLSKFRGPVPLWIEIVSLASHRKKNKWDSMQAIWPMFCYMIHTKNCLVHNNVMVIRTYVNSSGFIVDSVCILLPVLSQSNTRSNADSSKLIPQEHTVVIF